MKKQNILSYGGTAPFTFQISYSEIDATSPSNVFEHHCHEECEIYINVSGEVSFAVENTLYPIVPGSIVIARPGEYHHCIYHTNRLHRHFWILFSATGNERFLDVFYQREKGTGNLLLLPRRETEELFALCHQLTEETLTETETYLDFFTLIRLLNRADTVACPDGKTSDGLLRALRCVDADLSLTVREVARECGVSVNTLERQFARALGLSPIAYIRKKRLTHAAHLLSHGASVTEAAEASGFPDCSGFIRFFKENYHLTPLQYQKNLLRQTENNKKDGNSML